LFGHFCWQAAYDVSLLEGGLSRWIEDYPEKPFAVFSSAWPKVRGKRPGYALKTPDLPHNILFPEQKGEDKRALMLRRKDDKARRWMLVGEDLSISFQDVECLSDKELAGRASGLLSPTARKRFDFAGRLPTSFMSDFIQSHNSISRLTMTTGEGAFAPFSESCSFCYPESELAIFVLIDEGATDAERVRRAFERIGQWGYGKDASTGKGRFETLGIREIPLPKGSSANACYMLAPTVPEPGLFSCHYFSPFVRFGKHGDITARSSHPFKKPVVMADDGAVFITDDPTVFATPYIGKAVLGTSLANESTVAQGYSIYLPFRLEAGHE
jgi:CRISPR-associated protein Csm4